MKTHFIHKQLFVLLSFIFTTPCFGQVKSNTAKDSLSEPKGVFGGPQVLNYNLEEHDPYFLETWDIISSRGPKSITRNILQDKNGDFWFATWQGIMSYDGKLFTNHTLKEGLKHFHVFSLLEDNAGNIWIGTIGIGVYKYDGRSFTLFSTKDGLPDDFIQCMMQDKAGNIWFGTDGGVSRFDGKNFTNFTTEDGLSGNSVNSIVQDKTGKIWFGTRSGVNGDVSCYDGKSFTDFKNNEGLVFSNVRSMLEDRNGNIWIGGQNGLYKYDGNKLTNVSTNFTGFIFEDKAGNLWLSGEDMRGMALYKYDGCEISKITSSAQIFGVTECEAGNIWFGTMNGAYRYDGKSFTGYNE